MIKAVKASLSETNKFCLYGLYGFRICLYGHDSTFETPNGMYEMLMRKENTTSEQKKRCQ